MKEGTDHKEAGRIGARALAGSPKGEKPKKPEQEHDGKVHGMSIHRGKNKGYTVHHEYKHKESGATMRDEDPHVMNNQAELMEHIQQAMPEQGEGGGEGGEQPEGGEQ